jgi:adenylate kinase family enzyme
MLCRMLGRRIVIVGDSNSGKTTLATHLAERLGARFVELDALFWLPGWTPRPDDEFRALLQETLDGDGAWVAAGNYLSYRDSFWPSADTCIWLDFPLRITVPRLVRRSWRRYRTNELLWGTNRDRFWPMFRLWDTKESLLSFTVTQHRRRRRTLEATLAARHEWPHITFERLRGPAELRAWLASMELAEASH